MKIAICDDNLQELHNLVQLIAQYKLRLPSLEIEVEHFNSIEQLLKQSPNKYDVLILDIIISKYIKNLNWYLVILKDTAELQQTMLTQLFTGFIFMAAIICIILLITTSILSKYFTSLMGLAQTDSLTNLRNRTSYEQEMIIYGARLTDYKYFAIGVFDLNNLKELNDTLGHQMGDLYLKDFASILSDSFSHCPLFRIGGDEFLAVFLNMSETEIKKK